VNLSAGGWGCMPGSGASTIPMMTVNEHDRVYLDNAATSFPKPRRVHEAMVRYARSVGASPGRGGSRQALEAGSCVHAAREAIASLLGAGTPQNIVFTLNATDALNLAIKGIVAERRRSSPDRPVHLVTTAMDHNSVLRPYNKLSEDGQVRWTCVPADPETGRVDPASVRAAIEPSTALFATLHASNVSGSLSDIPRVSASRTMAAPSGCSEPRSADAAR